MLTPIHRLLVVTLFLMCALLAVRAPGAPTWGAPIPFPGAVWNVGDQPGFVGCGGAVSAAKRREATATAASQFAQMATIAAVRDAFPAEGIMTFQSTNREMVKSLSMAATGAIVVAGFRNGSYEIIDPVNGRNQFVEANSTGMTDAVLLADRMQVARLDNKERLWFDDLAANSGRVEVTELVRPFIPHTNAGRLSRSGDGKWLLQSFQGRGSQHVFIANINNLDQPMPIVLPIAPKGLLKKSGSEAFRAAISPTRHHTLLAGSLWNGGTYLFCLSKLSSAPIEIAPPRTAQKDANFSLEYSPSGNYLAAGDFKGRIHLWKFSRGSMGDDMIVQPIAEPLQLKKVKGAFPVIYRLGFSSTEDLIFVEPSAGAPQIWSLTTGTPVSTITYPSRVGSPQPIGMAFSRGGNILWLASNKWLFAFNSATGEVIEQHRAPENGEFTTFESTPNGDYIALGAKYGYVMLIRL